MPRQAQSKGKCTYCNAEVAKGAMSKHLNVCAQRKASIAKAEAGRTTSEALYHLRIEDAYAKKFWLNLEMRGSSSLQDLDHYLRGIWLECCGHLSQFSFGGWRGEELAMSRKVSAVLKANDVLTHLYDFGTTSETLIKVVSIRSGKATTNKPIVLMARNNIPEPRCMECDEPAAWLCTECLIEDNQPGWLCENHVEDHPHDNYGEPFPLVNSPRLGMCGYTGPAEPPY